MIVENEKEDEEDDFVDVVFTPRGTDHPSIFINRVAGVDMFYIHKQCGNGFKYLNKYDGQWKEYMCVEGTTWFADGGRLEGGTYFHTYEEALETFNKYFGDVKNG